MDLSIRLTGVAIQVIGVIWYYVARPAFAHRLSQWTTRWFRVWWFGYTLSRRLQCCLDDVKSTCFITYILTSGYSDAIHHEGSKLPYMQE